MPLAGAIIRASHVPDALIQSVIKDSDEVVNNSAALQADDELFIPGLADVRYVWRALLKWRSGAVPDLKWDLSLPSGATHDSLCMTYARDGSAGTIGSGSTNCLFDARMFSTTEVVAVGGAGTTWSTQGRLAYATGHIDMGATAGDIAIRWAQNTANASDTTISSGSWLELIKA